MPIDSLDALAVDDRRTRRGFLAGLLARLHNQRHPNPRPNAELHASYRSMTSNAKLAGQTAWQTISELTERALIHPELPLASPTR